MGILRKRNIILIKNSRVFLEFQVLDRQLF